MIETDVNFYLMHFKCQLPSADGVSHSHTLQQWPGTSTKRGEWQTAVSFGGGKFSFGHNDEQACLPFCRKFNGLVNFKRCLTFFWRRMRKSMKMRPNENYMEHGAHSRSDHFSIFDKSEDSLAFTVTILFIL